MKRVPTNRAAFLTLGILILSARETLAIDFSGVDLRPYLLVQETCLILPDPENPQIPLGSSKRDQSTFISQGGAVTSSLALQVQLTPYEGGFLQGIATPQERGPLASVVNAARLGTRTSCKIVAGCSGGGQTTVTWYGRNNNRRNSFTIAYGDSPANEAIPECSPEIESFRTALGRLLLDLKRHPNTEVTFSHPSAEPR